MTITIIGGSGFLGTRLTRRLLEAGHTVRIADKRPSHAYPELWTRCDIRNAPEEKAEFAESLTDADIAPGAAAEAARIQPMHSLVEVLRGSSAVINLAAEHRDDVTPKTLYDEVNVEGSRHVCAACTVLGIRTVVFTSSVAVYGFAPPGTDETGEIHYFNDYGRTKYLAEEQYRAWLKKDPMNYVENVAAFLQYCVEHNETLPCFDAGFDGKTAGRLHLFNYCDEPAYDMNTLVLDVCKALGRPEKRIFHWPYWLGYAGGLCFDVLAKVLHKKLPISSIRVKSSARTHTSAHRGQPKPALFRR